jgi:uncharacterized protein with FMN-binding domain
MEKGFLKMKGKNIIIVVAAILLIGGVYGGKNLADLSTYRRQVAAIEIGTIALDKIPDGNYRGSFDTVWVGAVVDVTVKDHRIVTIDLQHRHDQGEAAEVIPDRVIAAQSLNVDMVSGATNSCMVILKAVENALISAE